MGDFEYKCPNEHVYEDIRYMAINPASTLDAIKTYELRGDDIVLVTYPKAGTTWIGQIVRLLLNQDTNINIRLSQPIMEFAMPGRPTSLQQISDMAPPRTMATHLRPSLFKEHLQKTSPRVIVGMRNPKDVAVSYFNFYRATSALGKFTGTFDEYFSLFIKGEVVYGDFWEYVAAWWDYKDDPRFLFLFFEDMKEDLPKAVKDISDFLKLGLTGERLSEIAEQTTFNAMKDDRAVNFEAMPTAAYDSSISKYLRKGEVGEWVNTLSEDQSKAIDQRCKTVLEPLGIKFKFES